MDYIPKHLLDDDIVFHYCPANTAIEYILYEGKLRLSPRKNSVDPVERMNFQRALLLDRENEEVRKAGWEHINKVHQKIDKCKQVCFCKSTPDNSLGFGRSEKDSFGFLKPRMWDQYGNGYKGVCLAFSKSKLISTVGFQSKDVDYVGYTQMEEERMLFRLNEIEKMNEDQKNIDFDERVKRKVFRKHSDYSGENEFRICSFSARQFEWVDITGCLKAIIFSKNHLNEFSKKKIVEYSKSTGAEVIEVAWESEGVKINPYKPRLVQDRIDELNK